MYFLSVMFLIHTASLQPHSAQGTYHKSVPTFSTSGPSPERQVRNLNQPNTSPLATMPQQISEYQVFLQGKMEFSLASGRIDYTSTFQMITAFTILKVRRSPTRAQGMPQKKQIML